MWASTLSHSFPSLSEMAVDKFATLVESWNHSDGRGGWNLNCVRAINHWEVDLVANLLFVLRKERVSTECYLERGSGHNLLSVQCL